MIIAILLISPVALALFVVLTPRVRPTFAALLLAALVQALCVVLLVGSPESLTAYFRADALSLLFLGLLSIVLVATSIYLVGQFARSVPRDHSRHFATFAAFFLLFVDSMNGAILTTHLGLFWVFLEASTLTSVVLVNFDGTRRSLEAAWKYVFICSIGISLAFIGIVLLGIADLSNRSLFFTDLYRAAPSMSPFWLKMAFAFVLIGFGTKMGLAPVHSWLPDAHSEGPAPISALLSGALLNVALLGILRVDRILNAGGSGRFASSLLLTMGFLSLFVSAVFILGSTNYKRMLAYSSIEHMGIISIGFGAGGIGIFAALFHMVGHSLSKSAFFLTSGNLHDLAESNEISAVRSLLRRDRITAALVLAAFLAVSAVPPFSTFVSEVLLVWALIKRSALLVVLFLLLLVVILYGMGDRAVEIAFRTGAEEVEGSHQDGRTPRSPGHLSLWAYLPQVLLLALAALLGVYLPGRIDSMLHSAAALLGGGA